ncbi:MAG: TRAP transporter large permease subunit, partial [Defluviicoccus sp.]|nr:TRAP transporter large permease subunit [Defluviicoccus sp.]
MAEQSTGADGGRRRDRGAQLLAERREGRFVTASTRVLGAAITLIALTWAIELWLALGFQWFDEQALVACFGLTLAIVFIRFPFAGGRDRPSVPWYDAACAVVGVGASAYLIWIYGDIELNPFAMRGKMFWISAVLLPLMWEALRRTAGWSLTAVLSVFIAYAFVGHLAPGMLKGYEQDGYRMIAELGVTNVALLGLPLKIIVLTVVLFIWMGQLLLHTGASEWFTDLAAAVMGRSRGGSAKIAVVASG